MYKVMAILFAAVALIGQIAMSSHAENLRLQTQDQRRVYDVWIQDDSTFKLDMEEDVVKRVVLAFNKIAQKQKESGFDEFVFENVFLHLVPDGVPKRIHICFMGTERNASASEKSLDADAQTVIDELRLNIREYRESLEQLIGASRVKHLDLHTIIVERNGNVHFLVSDPENVLDESPSVPTQKIPAPQHRQPPPQPTPCPLPQINPSPSNRTEHAARPLGAPFLFYI